MQTKTTAASAQFAGPWAQMASGRPWPMLEPSADRVHWPDIADSLAKICRFNGHCTVFYSVAQHCCLVADLLPPPLRLHGLLHDAHEAITGDMIAPMKAALSQFKGGMGSLGLMEQATTAAIYEAAGLPVYSDRAVETAVRHADLTMLATEKRDVMAPAFLEWDSLPAPAPFRIAAWPWPKAAEEWLSRLDRYLPHDKRRI